MIKHLAIYPDRQLDLYVQAVTAKKTEDVVILDISKLSSIADILIICSGRSNRQVKAVAEYVEVELKKQGIRPLSVEGVQDGHWVLMDYGHIIIHIFYEPIRGFYDIEGLWSDARRVTTASLGPLTKESQHDARSKQTP